MRRSIAAAIALVPLSLTLSTRANVIIHLTATDVAGNPLVQPVVAGTAAIVEIGLTVDEADDPLPDIRAIQLDFSATDAVIGLDGFTWFVDSAGYAVQLDALPRPGVATSRSGSSPSLITLTTELLKVAEVRVTVAGDGQLDIGFSPDNASTSNAAVRAGFGAEPEFSAANDNVSGGTFSFVVVSGMDDSDGDGVPNDTDAFPSDPTESVDTDDDGTGNNADLDDDGDGVVDAEDAFPLNPAEVSDTDLDGVGDNADAFPSDADEQVDTDNDGTGDNQDIDDDGDGVEDSVDAFPLDPAESADTNGNGIGDNADANQNTSARVSGGICGVGMLGSLVFMLIGLVGQRHTLRRRTSRPYETH